MVFRLTDPRKWRKAWFASLSLKAKLTWIYLCDECEPCGVWYAEWNVASARLGFKIDEKFIRTNFFDRVQTRQNLVFLKTFYEFQYGSVKMWPAKQKSINQLESLGFSVPKGCDEGDMGGDTPGVTPYTISNSNSNSNSSIVLNNHDALHHKVEREVFDFEAIYENYPRKVGKSSGLKSCAKQIKTKEEYEQLLLAVKNYSAHCLLDQTEKKFIKKFNNFLKDDYWRDFIDADIPTPELSYEERMRKIAERNI